MSHLHVFKRPTSDRSDSIQVLNWETGESEVILLDESKTPVENAEKFYKQASKLKRGATKVLPLIEECKADMLYLADNEALLESIVASEEGDELDLLAQIELELIEQWVYQAKERTCIAGERSTKEQEAQQEDRRLGVQAAVLAKRL